MFNKKKGIIAIPPTVETRGFPREIYHELKTKLIMENAILKVLPKIVQWEDIPYSAGLHCQCGRADIAYAGWSGFENRYIKPIAVGWCETDYGLMGVFECPECHGKFRCHCGAKKFASEDEFAADFEIFVRCCANKEEVINQVKELEKEN